jgi:hypothetical protein
MVATNWLKRVVVVAGLLAISTTGARALTLNVTGGGLEAGNQNYGCPTAPGTCSLAAQDYTLTGPAIAVGTITINPAGTEIDIALSVASANFTGSGAPISFGPVTYLAHLSGASVITGPGSIDSGFGTGTVSGSVNADPFSVAAANVSISCDFPGGTGQCGVSFGESGFTNVLGNDWRHTFNVTVALPEPSTALLALFGLAGLALRARAR